MKKLFVSALAMLAVALGFTACSSEDELVNETPAQGQKVTVIATTEEPAQRTALEQDGDKYKVVWSEDDKIKLIDASSNFTEFTLINDYKNQSTGEFTGTVTTAGTYTAYYPSTYDGTTWPAAQTYVANNIPLGVPMKATGIIVEYGEGPMISPISFKNEGGILRLNLEGTAKVTSIRISATGLDAIMLDCSKETDGYVQLNSDGVPFHIAVKAADYSGLKIEITDNTGAVCTKKLKSGNTITVQRSMITDITLTASSFVPTIGQAERNGGSKVTWVRLWEGGPKFAEYNVGAESAQQYGGYYTWGGTRNDFGRTFEFTRQSDHNTGTAVLSGDSDTATNLWGGNWRMPTRDELQALLNNCNVEWTTVEGMPGRRYTGRGAYASNSIFLPSAGYCNTEGKASTTDAGGRYWSSSVDSYTTPFSSGVDTECSPALFFTSNTQYVDKDNIYRSYGCSVRAVLKE